MQRLDKSGSGVGTQAVTVRERLLRGEGGYSAAEKKVAGQLLANYPAAGLTTISKLAKAAGVSDPTVLRLADKMGFQSFAEFQQALLAEVEAHMRHPLTLRTAHPPAESDLYHDFFRQTLHICEATARGTTAEEYERLVSLLADPAFEILCLGGRFSRFLAGNLARNLSLLRVGVTAFDGATADLVDMAVDMGRTHMLIVFDYRRYQDDVVAFAMMAKERGATIVLFTDIWRSPIAEIADVTLVAPTETASPYDTLVTPMLQLEAVVAGIAARLAGDGPDRMTALEEARTAHREALAKWRGKAFRGGKGGDAK